jgi:signal transduction histidine kinase/CheY-like chemotaxis protein
MIVYELVKLNFNIAMDKAIGSVRYFMKPRQAMPLVLVADDEINTTIMLQHIFERDGYRVERANDGFTAVESAKRILPDLILLDIRMPRLDGFEVLRLLRDDPQTATIPTIIITANATAPADIERGLNLGADDYLQKPFAPQELLARARSKIRARQLEDALQKRTQQLAILLHAGERLNQYLELDDLLDLTVNVTIELLPGDLVMFHLLDEEADVIDSRIIDRMGAVEVQLQPDFIDRCLQSGKSFIWEENCVPLENYTSSMTATLQHGVYRMGLLTLLSTNTVYDENHLRLLTGIGRQASLALRNAQLYQIQANYAQHLEDMVAERTQELESAQQLLIRSEKLASIGHLAASIAHEINNPLMPIGLLLERLADDLKESGAPVDFQDIEVIQEHVERIRRIVRSLLDFSRPETNLRSLDITHILEGIAKLNQKFFEHERVQIIKDFAPIPPVFGSKDQLEAVFMNLSLNAKAAMEGGGSLMIKTYTEQECAVIEFTDTGLGIPKENLAKIFDPFFSTKSTGTGLGLFVCYSVIEGHHGTIEVESEVGKGTRFTIKLPGYYK